MKALRINKRNIGALAAMLLGFTILTAAGVKSKSEKDNAASKAYYEMEIEALSKELLASFSEEPAPTTVIVIDDSYEEIFRKETSLLFPDNDKEISQWLNKSDLLMQRGKTIYYQTSQHH